MPASLGLTWLRLQPDLEMLQRPPRMEARDRELFVLKYQISLVRCLVSKHLSTQTDHPHACYQPGKDLYQVRHQKGWDSYKAFSFPRDGSSMEGCDSPQQPDYKNSPWASARTSGKAIWTAWKGQGTRIDRGSKSTLHLKLHALIPRPQVKHQSSVMKDACQGQASARPSLLPQCEIIHRQSQHIYQNNHCKFGLRTSQGENVCP